MQLYLLRQFPTLLKFVVHDGFWNSSGDDIIQHIRPEWRLGTLIRTWRLGATITRSHKVTEDDP